MEKRHVKVFHAGGDPAILARKIYFHDSIQRDVLFRLKLGTCLAGIALWLHPTPEDSGMSFIEQSGTLPRNQNPVQLDHSAEIHPFGESPQKSSALSEEMDEEIF